MSKMAKRSVTLFSITTTVVVLIVAIVILLVVNYINSAQEAENYVPPTVPEAQIQ